MTSVGLESLQCAESKAGSPLGWMGWTRLACAGALCLLVGNAAARLVGFPLYPGYQGVLVDQPITTMVLSLVAMVIAIPAGMALATPILPSDERWLTPAAGAFVLAGFSSRGGDMTSVLQAASGRDIYWLLAGELAVLSLLVAGVFQVLRRRGTHLQPITSEEEERHPSALNSLMVQLVVTVILLLLFGKSTMKAQAMMSVLCASLVGVWVAHVFTECLWRGAWCVPLAIGLGGYAINALTAAGIETANLHSAAAGLGMPLPLDYAAMGPVGVLLGELLSRHERAEGELADAGQA